MENVVLLHDNQIGFINGVVNVNRPPLKSFKRLRFER